MKSVKRELFRTCRKSKGTQSAVALQLGISTVYLRKIESGVELPGRDLMFRISNHFDKTVEELFPDYFANSEVV